MDKSLFNTIEHLMVWFFFKDGKLNMQFGDFHFYEKDFEI